MTTEVEHHLLRGIRNSGMYIKYALLFFSQTSPKEPILLHYTIIYIYILMHSIILYTSLIFNLTINHASVIWSLLFRSL